MKLPVLGIDPGGRKSGIVLRWRDDLLGWGLEVRPDSGRMPGPAYTRAVLARCSTILRSAGLDPADRSAYVVGVETVAYWPEKSGGRPRDQRGLYGTAIVLGAVWARWPECVVVGSGRGVANYHPQAYPAPIRQPVNGKGKDRMVDVRAAWDHSLAAETVWLTEQRKAR